MIKKKRVYLGDIAKAKFIDRFFYYILNHLRLDISGKSYMTTNPLKWSLLTLIVSVWVVFVYIVIFPVIGIPAVLYDTYKMPKKYIGEDADWYVDNVWLIRELQNE